MSLLTKANIIQELASKRVVITPPLDSTQINGASIDLTLGRDFRTFKARSSAIDILESTDYKRYTNKRTCKSIIIRPQETILGITSEKIRLPDNIVGWLEGRSRFARLGLLIHISAGLIHPGACNRQVLEITNLSPNILKLYANERICQLVLEYTNGPVSYRGKFRSQLAP
jgi:dCTP deaminase